MTSATGASIRGHGANGMLARGAVACAAVALSALALDGWAQAPSRASAADRPPVTQGIYNWIHTPGDAELAFAFYRDIFGAELARSPFAGPAPPNAPPERIRAVAEAGSDPLVWDLTNTEGSRFRTVFMRVANTPFGLELSEFFDVPRDERPANPWDPGASMLMFDVRDLDATAARLQGSGAPAVTLGGVPLDTPAGRSMLVRDPDGYLVRVTQASAAAVARAAPEGDVLRTSIGLSVANTRAAVTFYRDLLGFEIRETRSATTDELRLNGLDEGEFRQTTMSIPGVDATVLLMEFTLPATVTPPAKPFRWRIQDVGAPQFQLQVIGLDALLERTQNAGFRFLTIDARPIQRPFGRFVFAIDSDGVLVEFVEPSTPQ